MSDSADSKLYAYNLATKARDSAKDFNTLQAATNEEPTGIWSNGTTMWVADYANQKIYAYSMSTKARDADKDITTTGVIPAGLTSNQATMWVADFVTKELFAYNVSTKARDSSQDFATLEGAGNESLNGIWTDGNTMWVADSTDSKIYSYNGAISSDATLSALTVSPRDIIGFTADNAYYNAGVANTVTQATVTAAANHPASSLAILPTDADSGTDGHQVNLSTGRNTVTITVTAEDSTEKTYTVSINRGVTTPFGWKTIDDLDGLPAAMNNDPTGIWSDGTTIWIADEVQSKIYAYRTSDTSRDASQDFDTLRAADNMTPNGIWSDGTTMWIVDRANKTLHAYDLTTKVRDSSKEFNTLDGEGNDQPTGIWSNGITMWVVDYDDAKIYAYRMSDKTRDASKEFNTLAGAGNDYPTALWSDGATMWVTQLASGKAYAYSMTTKARESSREYNTPLPAGNQAPRGIWSDGITTWITDLTNDKIYSYNHPASNNADLKTLAVNSIEVSGFNPATTTYSHDRARRHPRDHHQPPRSCSSKQKSPRITPPDADSRPGHQVTINKASHAPL